jgi:hypothetical protein
MASRLAAMFGLNGCVPFASWAPSDECEFT